MRNDTEMEIMKAQAELYGKFYAARQAVVSKIPHFWFGAFIKHPARASLLVLGRSCRL